MRLHWNSASAFMIGSASSVATSGSASVPMSGSGTMSSTTLKHFSSRAVSFSYDDSIAALSDPREHSTCLSCSCYSLGHRRTPSVCKHRLRRGGCTIAVVQTNTPPSQDDGTVKSPEDGPVRIDVLQRLAEQAMSDPTFRDEARDDLPGTLLKYGYDLTPQELALVLRFRRSLADAGVDLDLVDGKSDERLADILERLQRRARSEGWT